MEIVKKTQLICAAALCVFALSLCGNTYGSYSNPTQEEKNAAQKNLDIAKLKLSALEAAKKDNDKVQQDFKAANDAYEIAQNKARGFGYQLENAKRELHDARLIARREKPGSSLSEIEKDLRVIDRKKEVDAAYLKYAAAKEDFNNAKLRLEVAQRNKDIVEAAYRNVINAPREFDIALSEAQRLGIK